MPQVNISSQNFNGKTVSVTFYSFSNPSVGINLGTFTAPFIYSADDVWGTYEITITEFNLICSYVINPTPTPTPTLTATLATPTPTPTPTPTETLNNCQATPVNYTPKCGIVDSGTTVSGNTGIDIESINSTARKIGGQIMDPTGQYSCFASPGTLCYNPTGDLILWDGNQTGVLFQTGDVIKLNNQILDRVVDVNLNYVIEVIDPICGLVEGVHFNSGSQFIVIRGCV